MLMSRPATASATAATQAAVASGVDTIAKNVARNIQPFISLCVSYAYCDSAFIAIQGRHTTTDNNDNGTKRRAKIPRPRSRTPLTRNGSADTASSTECGAIDVLTAAAALETALLSALLVDDVGS